MSPISFALAAILAPVALAIPQSPAYGGYGYGHHGHPHPSHAHHRPSGVSTGGPVPIPSGGPSSGTGLSPIGGTSAPYGFGNSTGIAGPTGTGTAPVIQSTVTVIPQPLSSPASSIESSPVGGNTDIASSGTSGLGNSPTGLSSAGGEGQCGPATVTVTSANTVTVTVPAAPISSPQESSPISASSVPSAPYPIGNATSVIGSTGTIGTIGTGIPTAPSVPVLSGLPSSSASSPVASSTSANSPVGGTSAAPVQSSVAAHTYHQIPPYHHLSAPAPVESSSAVAPVVPQTTSTSVPGGEFYTHPASSASSPAYTAPSSTPSPSHASSPSTSGGDVAPRGLVYNTASLTSLFKSPVIGWCYNWDSAPGGEIPSGMNFVPQLWNTSSLHLPQWKNNVNTAIANGATHIMGFNEPDLSAQANMSPQEAADAWNDMEQFAGKVKIGSPAVCNGGDDGKPGPDGKPIGLQWMSGFLEACSGCTIDFLALHWYGTADAAGVSDLQKHIGKAQAVAKGKPIWLTEFEPSGSTEQQASFMSTILPWLDDKSNGVERYAYFMVDNVLASGNSLTSLGSQYAS